jgi:hypothetical protein
MMTAASVLPPAATQAVNNGGWLPVVPRWAIAAGATALLVVAGVGIYQIRGIFPKRNWRLDGQFSADKLTWTNNKTGLTWTMHRSQHVSWEVAKRYCETLTLHELRSWRLPTLKEELSFWHERTEHPHEADSELVRIVLQGHNFPSFIDWTIDARQGSAYVFFGWADDQYGSVEFPIEDERPQALCVSGPR